MKSTADCYRALLEPNNETLEHQAFRSVKLDKKGALVFENNGELVQHCFLDYREWSIKPKLAEHWTNIYPNYPNGISIFPSWEEANESTSPNCIRTVLMREVPKEG